MIEPTDEQLGSLARTAYESGVRSRQLIASIIVSKQYPHASLPDALMHTGKITTRLKEMFPLDLEV